MELSQNDPDPAWDERIHAKIMLHGTETGRISGPFDHEIDLGQLPPEGEDPDEFPRFHMEGSRKTIELDDKYTIILDLDKGIFKSLRYEDEWRNLIGDNLILELVQALLKFYEFGE